MTKGKKTAKTLVIVISAAVLAAAAGIYFYFNQPLQFKKIKSPLLRTGIASENIIIGYREGRTYTMHDFVGTYDIVLVFLGQSAGARLLEDSIAETKLPGKKTMLITLKQSEGEVTVSEPYAHTGLRYRFHASSLPPMYRALKDPGVIILDRSGAVRYIYSGYSPTIMRDLSDALTGRQK